MFGLTKREQRWKAEQRAAEVMVELAQTTVRAAADVRIAEAQTDAELELLRRENAELRAALAHGVEEPLLGVPLSTLAHATGAVMVCSDHDAACAEVPAGLRCKGCPLGVPAAREPIAWRFRSRLAAGSEWSDWRHVGYKPQGPVSEYFQMEPLYSTAGVSGTHELKENRDA